ncbi:protein TORMOZ EMBRYO DEFECTIVE [Nymphaea colorata]|nr:protein TORMOZ EMBRYO DEFECTIVE [Nymphaea colorata]
MMTSPSNYKSNYRCTPAFERFYTGGPYAVSPDSSFLACACDNDVKIVDALDSSVRATLEGDSGRITAITIGPDGRFLFSASHSRQIRVWDLSSFKCVRSWKAREGIVMNIACDSSGGLVATAEERKVLVWDVEGGYCTHYFQGHEGVVRTILFHPDANHLLLFSGSDDGTVRVWDLVTKKCASVLRKHFSTVTSLAVSENGWTLLSAARDRVVNLWNLRNYNFEKTITTYEVVEAICVIPSESVFATTLGKIRPKVKGKKNSSPPIHFLTVGDRGIVRLWSSECADCLFEQKSSDASIASDENDSQRGFISAVVLPKDQGLLCVTFDEQFLFYDPVKDDESMFQLNLRRRLVGSNEEISDLKFLGDEERYLAVATNIGQVRVFDLASRTCCHVLEGHTDIILCLDSCVLASGRSLLASGSKDNSVRIWDTETRCCIGVAKGHLDAVTAVAFSKKKKNFVVTGSKDRTIKVWSLDGISDDAGHVVNFKTKAVVAAHDKDINALAVSPNDAYVCSGSQDRTASIWKLPDLVSVVVLKGHKRGIWSVEFSPVDQCVMTASGDCTIKIWAIADGTCLKTFEGHTSSVFRASFLTRGTQFVSCGDDGLVKLWTIKSNECIATYEHHDAQVFALAVGQRTEMFTTGSTDSVINLWHDCTAADMEAAALQKEEAVLKDQDLENAVLDADYLKAIRLAFELRKPHRLFNLFSDICSKGHAENQILKALHAFGKEELRQLIEYIREWNTKPKLCHVAQFVLFQIFNVLSPTEIIEIKGIGELLEGLVSYSQRHFSRMDRLVRSTFLLDYVLTEMSVICPDNASKAPKDDANDGWEIKSNVDLLPSRKDDKEESVPQLPVQSSLRNKVPALSIHRDSSNGDQNVGIDNRLVEEGHSLYVSQDETVQEELSCQPEEKGSSKKRKSSKSRNKIEKKMKKAASTGVPAISLKA